MKKNFWYYTKLHAALIVMILWGCFMFQDILRSPSFSLYDAFMTIIIAIVLPFIFGCTWRVNTIRENEKQKLLKKLDEYREKNTNA